MSRANSSGTAAVGMVRPTGSSLIGAPERGDVHQLESGRAPRVRALTRSVMPKALNHRATRRPVPCASLCAASGAAMPAAMSPRPAGRATGTGIEGSRRHDHRDTQALTALMFAGSDTGIDIGGGRPASPTIPAADRHHGHRRTARHYRQLRICQNHLSLVRRTRATMQERAIRLLRCSVATATATRGPSSCIRADHVVDLTDKLPAGRPRHALPRGAAVVVSRNLQIGPRNAEGSGNCASRTFCQGQQGLIAPAAPGPAVPRASAGAPVVVLTTLSANSDLRRSPMTNTPVPCQAYT